MVRWAYSDPYRDYWIECYDPDQSESKYFFNTWSQETHWKMPLAFKYFCKWKTEPRPDRKKRIVTSTLTAKVAAKVEQKVAITQPTTRRKTVIKGADSDSD